MKSHFQNWLDKEHHYSQTDHYLKKADKELKEAGFLKKDEKITKIVSLPRLAELRDCFGECFEYKTKNKTVLYSVDLCMTLYMHYVLVQESIFHSFDNWLKENNYKDNGKPSLLNQYKKEMNKYYKNKIGVNKFIENKIKKS